MSLRLNGSTSGYTELDAGAVAGNNTIKMPTSNGSAYQVLRNGATAGTTEFGGAIVSGTAVASTSGTSIDFTGIPSWVKRVTVMLAGVSTSGTSIVQVQLGSTSFSTSGYKSTASYTSSVGGFAQATSGFITDTSFASASLTRSGLYVFSLINSNTWVGSGNIGGDATGQVTFACAGNSPALSGTLDRVRITTVNGTDQFDAGTVNILYE